ncbi:MAG: rhomboid family intramembrane serine protease [Pirellulaceae bacterium]|nr:rhomboid family intramembrane serine protease [Pirellulaceae bacterium]
MRQAGTLPTEAAARQFTSWLIAQRIDAQAEAEGSAWAIWVRDEDQLPAAREALQHFAANPQDARYRDAHGAAAARLREEDRQRQAIKGNVVTMRDRWGAAGGGISSVATKRSPLILLLIGICIVAALFTDTLGKQMPRENSLLDALLFVNPRQFIQLAPGGLDIWVSVRSGQIWRLVTPIFVHYGITHLVFNMMCLYMFGGQIENRRGTRFTLVLMLLLAVLSNVGQAIESSLTGGAGFAFGGMSGVVYGLFGYLLVKVKFDNREGYLLSPATVFMGLLWFVLCIARDYPPFDVMLAAWIPKIANSAHAVGLFAGMAIAYAPLLARRSA